MVLLRNSRQTLLSVLMLLHECIRVLHFLLLLSGQLTALPLLFKQLTLDQYTEWWQVFVLARYNAKGLYEYAMSQDEPLLLLLWIISSRPTEAE